MRFGQRKGDRRKRVMQGFQDISSDSELDGFGSEYGVDSEQGYNSDRNAPLVEAGKHLMHSATDETPVAINTDMGTQY